MKKKKKPFLDMAAPLGYVPGLGRGKSRAFRQQRPSCNPPQTVKKLLEQKRRRETGDGQATVSQGETAHMEVNPSGRASFSGSLGSTSMTAYPASLVSRPHSTSHGRSWSDYHHRYNPSDDFSGCLSPCQLPLGFKGTIVAGSSPSTESSTHYCQSMATTSEFMTSPLSSHTLVPSMFGEPPAPGAAWHSVASVIEGQGSDAYLMDAGSLIAEINPVDLDQARTEIQSMGLTQLLHQDEDGDTLLHLYAVKGQRCHAYVVAEHFRELGQLDVKEHMGKTPLLVATTANQPEIVHDLISLGADINAADLKGQTALHLAAIYGFPDIIKVVAAHRPLNVDVEARNFEGLTPLHCAIISQNSAFKKLMAACSAPAQVQLHNQETMYCVQLLLSLGASCASQDMKSNKTVLHFAVQDGNLPIITFFLAKPKPDHLAFVNMKAHGNTALHMAAGLSAQPFQEQIICLLLNHGADASLRNLENEQAVHLLPAGETAEQMRQLLKRSRAMASSRRRSQSL